MDSNLGLRDDIEVLKAAPSPGTRVTKVEKVRLEVRYSLNSQPEAEVHALFGLPDGRAWESGGGAVPVVAKGR